MAYCAEAAKTALQQFYLQCLIFACYLLPVPIQRALNPFSTSDKKAEFANSTDLDEVAHYEPLHLDLHCLPTSH